MFYPTKQTKLQPNKCKPQPLFFIKCFGVDLRPIQMQSVLPVPAAANLPTSHGQKWSLRLIQWWQNHTPSPSIPWRPRKQKDLPNFAGPPGESESVTAGVMPAGRAYLVHSLVTVAVISPRSAPPPFTQPNKWFYPTQQMKLQPNKCKPQPLFFIKCFGVDSRPIQLGKCIRSCPSQPLQFLPIG